MQAQQDQPILFDVNAQFRSKLLSGTEKIAVASRFGTDAEWSARTRKQQLVKSVLGRGKSQYSSAGSERADFELWEKIKDPSSADLDEFEAEKMVSRANQSGFVRPICGYLPRDNRSIPNRNRSHASDANTETACGVRTGGHARL